MPVYTLGRQFSFKFRGETPDPIGGTGSTSLTGVSGSDSDGDGYNDEFDAFWNDPTEWLDIDSDGVGDNADVFPDDPTETADTDSDGVGDNADLYPLDPTRSITLNLTLSGLESDIRLSDVDITGTLAFATDTQKLMVFNNTSGLSQWSEYNSVDE